MKFLSKTEMRQLMQAASVNPQHHLLFLLTYHHALRASEAVSLRWEDIQGGKINIKRLKGSLPTRQRIVRRDDALFNEEALLLGRQESGKIFGGYTRHTFTYLMRKYCKLAGIPMVLAHPHILKHSICMHSIKKAGIENVRTLAGHKSLNSTGYYLHRTDDEAMQEVVAALEEQ